MPLELAKAAGAGFRDPDKVVSQVTRHLLKDYQSDRRSDVVHPSEAAHAGWCPRATYYRITGAEAEIDPRQLRTEMVFETGHDAHRKWQDWFREMGILSGSWRCLNCRLWWEDVSPTVCPNCEVGVDLIRYAEVPVAKPEYLLAGSADADLVLTNGNRLIEVKTIGVGTVRIEAPKLVERYTYTHADKDGNEHTDVDWYHLWTGIRQPFPAHLRQGMLYCLCADRDEIVFIYDPKFLTAPPKEFEVKFRRDVIEDILQQCLIIKRGLELGRPPKRPVWAEADHRSCKQCPFRKGCWGGRAG